jgi:hypothetical protein
MVARTSVDAGLWIWFPARSESPVLTPKELHNKAQGKRSATLGFIGIERFLEP